MSEPLRLIIIILTVLPTAVIAGCGAIYVFNRLPASWLCDYNEEPSEQLKDTSRQRIKSHPWKLALSAFFAAAGIYCCTIGGHSLAYTLPLMVCVWLLVMIAVADAKYMIIPDQLTVFLLLMSGAFIPFDAEIKSMLTGAAAGAGVMLLVALAGYFITGRESLGFGDVKLMAAVGMLTGLYGCVAVMAAASLAAGLWFMFGMLRGRFSRGDMKPLGPFLAGAAIVYLLVF